MTAHAMVAMPDLLGQLGREVSSLAEEIERLQDTLSDVLMAVPVNSELMERAQSLDHVYQHMKQLELVLERAVAQRRRRIADGAQLPRPRDFYAGDVVQSALEGFGTFKPTARGILFLTNDQRAARVNRRTNGMPRASSCQVTVQIDMP